MHKLIVMSVLVMTVALPIAFARERHPVRGLKRMIALFAAYVLLWVLALKYVYPTLYYPDL